MSKSTMPGFNPQESITSLDDKRSLDDKKSLDGKRSLDFK